MKKFKWRPLLATLIVIVALDFWYSVNPAGYDTVMARIGFEQH